MKIFLNNVNITDICGGLNISGSLSQATRVAKLKIVKGEVNVNIGNAISIIDDSGNEIYYGYIWTITANSNDGFNSILAHDGLIYLAKNVTEKGVFISEGVHSVLNSISVETGFEVIHNLPNILVNIKKPGQTIYTVLKTLLNEASKKTGEIYYPTIQDRKLHIVKVGAVASNVIEYRSGVSVGAITSKTYKDSLDKMVNKVLVLDKNGKKISEIKSGLERKYGTTSVAVKKKEEAKKRLKSPHSEITVGIIADWSYTTGKYTEVVTGGAKVGFYITSDSHGYSDGIHTANLTLERWS